MRRAALEARAGHEPNKLTSSLARQREGHRPGGRQFVLGVLLAAALAALLGQIRVARADIPLTPPTEWTPWFDGTGDVTFEIRYFLPSDGWVNDPEDTGSWIHIQKETATTITNHVVDRKTGAYYCDADPEDPDCRPSDQWITEHVTIFSNEPFRLVLHAGQNFACTGQDCPSPYPDPRPHLNPAILRVEAPGIGAWVRLCVPPPGGEPTPYCPPPPEPRCFPESGQILDRDLMVGGRYVGSDPQACKVLVQRRGQPGAPANLKGTMSYDDEYYDKVVGTAFGPHDDVDGYFYVLLKGLPGEVDAIARYAPLGGDPVMTGLSLAGEPTSLALDRFGGHIIGMKSTTEKPGRGLMWNTSLFFDDADVLAVSRASNSCLLYFSTPSLVRRYDICTNNGTAETFLAQSAAALAVLPGGDVIVASAASVLRYSSDGALRAVYNISGVTGLAADADSSFWAVNPDSLQRWSVADGTMTESLTYTGSTFEPATVAVNYDMPVKPIIFVHGFRQAGLDDAVRFGDIIGPLRSEFGLDAVTTFRWYQDASLQGLDCPGSYPTPTGSIWINPLGLNDAECDSQAAIGPNAVLLKELVEQKYEESGGQPVILLGYSQGGAIIRGMLAYAAETDPTFGTTMVDSAFFFASVHEGSYVARFGVATENFLTNPVTILNSYGTSVLAYQAARWIADQANLFIDRPAIHDLDPEGQWMAWANSPARQLPPIEYYNAYGSIQVKVSACGYLVGCWDAPFGDTNLGDMVILQGNNANPYDGPRPLGGSRFSVNGSVEWEVSDIVRYNAAKLAVPVVGPAVAAAELAKVAEAAGTSPVQHMNFPDHTGSFSVSHCGSGGQVILADEVLALIRAKLGAGGYTC